MANMISFFRVILAIYILVSLRYFPTEVFYTAAVWLTLAVVVLDAIDGIVARALNEQSDIGSVIDILGDRIVENAYWIVFAGYGWIGVWVPLVVMIRSFVTDTLRSLAFAQGFTAFGDKSMVKNKIGYLLTSSRYSRAIYGAAKVIAFMSVIAVHIPEKNHPAFLDMVANISVFTAVLFCVIRALPVIFESKRFFKSKNEIFNCTR